MSKRETPTMLRQVRLLRATAAVLFFSWLGCNDSNIDDVLHTIDGSNAAKTRKQTAADTAPRFNIREMFAAYARDPQQAHKRYGRRSIVIDDGTVEEIVLAHNGLPFTWFVIGVADIKQPQIWCFLDDADAATAKALRIGQSVAVRGVLSELHDFDGRPRLDMRTCQLAEIRDEVAPGRRAKKHVRTATPHEVLASVSAPARQALLKYVNSAHRVGDMPNVQIWNPQMPDSDCTLALHYPRDRGPTSLVVERSHPNGMRFVDNQWQYLPLVFPKDFHGLDGADQPKDDYHIEVAEYDFDHDGTPEIVVAIGDGLSDLLVEVVKYDLPRSPAAKSKGWSLVGAFIGQREADLEGNTIALPFGSHGLYAEYTWADGRLIETTDAAYRSAKVSIVAAPGPNTSVSAGVPAPLAPTREKPSSDSEGIVAAGQLECQQKMGPSVPLQWNKRENLYNFANDNGVEPTRCGTRLTATRALVANVYLEVEAPPGEGFPGFVPTRTRKQRISLGPNRRRGVYLAVPKKAWPDSWNARVRMVVETLDGKPITIAECQIAIEFIDDQ